MFDEYRLIANDEVDTTSKVSSCDRFLDMVVRSADGTLFDISLLCKIVRLISTKGTCDVFDYRLEIDRNGV